MRNLKLLLAAPMLAAFALAGSSRSAAATEGGCDQGDPDFIAGMFDWHCECGGQTCRKFIDENTPGDGYGQGCPLSNWQTEVYVNEECTTVTF
jgi:hypothetical protein